MSGFDEGKTMRFSWPVYSALAVVGSVSFLAASLLPTTDLLRAISGFPAVIALIAAVFQVFRDQAQHEKVLATQRDQQHFVLGVTSHMANVAFDRHVEFCEKYIQRMQKGLTELFHKGPTKECLPFCIELADIRLSYRTWLTSDLQSQIMPFEEALTKIAGRNIELEGLPVGDKRSQAVEEMHDVFADVLGIPRLRGTTDEKVVPARIMDHLQDLLGVKQLVQLRIALVAEAVKTLEKRS